MNDPKAVTEAHLEIGRPKRFTDAGVFLATSFGVVLMGLPFLATVLLISFVHLGLFAILILPLAALAVDTFFLPLGFSNPRIARWVRSAVPEPTGTIESFIVQLSLTPRLHWGFRATWEDADDVGRLSFTDTAIIFAGDAVQMTVPFSQITRLRSEGMGLRGLFLYGGRSVFEVPGFQPRVERIQFAERSSWHLLGSRQIARRLLNRFEAVTAQKEARP